MRLILAIALLASSAWAQLTVNGIALTGSLTAGGSNPKTVAISPANPTVNSGSTTNFSCVGTGGLTNTCTWSILSETCSGDSINSSTGVYTATNGACTATIKALGSDSSTFSVTTATVSVVGVSVTPNAPVNIIPGGSATTFTATVTGAANTSVTWTCAGCAGSINASTGVYTPPATYAGATDTVTATSAQDNTKTGTSAFKVGTIYFQCSFDFTPGTTSFCSTNTGIFLNTGSGSAPVFSASPAPPSGTDSLQFQVTSTSNGDRSDVAIDCTKTGLSAMPCNAALDQELYVSYEYTLSADTITNSSATGTQIKHGLSRKSGANIGFGMYGSGYQFDTVTPNHFTAEQDDNLPADTTICKSKPTLPAVTGCSGKTYNSCTSNNVPSPCVKPNTTQTAGTWYWAKEHEHRTSATNLGLDEIWWGSSIADSGTLIYQFTLPDNGWNDATRMVIERGMVYTFWTGGSGTPTMNIRNMCIANFDTVLISGCH